MVQALSEDCKKKVEETETNTEVLSSGNSIELPEAKGTTEVQEQLERKTEISSQENIKETAETRTSDEDLKTGSRINKFLQTTNLVNIVKEKFENCM